MRNITLFLLLLVHICALAAGQGDATDMDYDIAGAETGVQGTYLVRVSIVSRKPYVTEQQISRAAVHGVLFKGFSGQGFAAQRAMVTAEAEAAHRDFFKSFWTNGDFQQFAIIINPAEEHAKVKGKGYRITSVVQVKKDNLRKHLEAAGVLKRLGSTL